MRPWGRPRPRQQHPKQVFRSNIRNPHDIHPASHLLASDLMTYTGEQNLFTGSSALFTTLLCAQDTSEVLEHVLVVAKDGCDRVRPVCEVLHGHRSASLKDLGRAAEAAELCAPVPQCWNLGVFLHHIPAWGPATCGGVRIIVGGGDGDGGGGDDRRALWWTNTVHTAVVGMWEEREWMGREPPGRRRSERGGEGSVVFVFGGCSLVEWAVRVC